MKKNKIIAILFILFVCFVFSGCGAKKPAVSPAVPVKIGITLATVVEHNTPEDCWMVINNNIYSLADYILNHPGGEKRIIDYCGKEATVVFETMGSDSGKTHSDQARQLLEQYYIGSLTR